MKIDWIEFNDTWQSFKDQGLNLPGFLIEVRRPDNSIYIELIGSISCNANHGDQPDLVPNSYITRYSEIFDFSEIENE